MLSELFICAGKERCSYEHHVPAPLFRRSFNLSRRQSAEFTICGLGFYEVWFNGKKITKGRLAPYISNTCDYVYYDKYDVTDLVRPGENVIGVVLGNGLQNCFGGGTWDLDKTPFTSEPKMAIHFSADEFRFEADSHFMTSPSPITFDEYRSGEFFDARLIQPGWNAPGFDDSNWTPAIPTEAPTGKRVYCTAEPIGEFNQIAPVSITPCDEGYIYDFGKNTAGICRLKVRGKQGQEIVMRHAELMNDGKFYNNCLIFQPEDYRQKDIYICRGENEEIYKPSFTYHGFRYVLVSGITAEQAVPELLTLIELHSDLKTIGSFECSNKTVNAVQQLCLNSAISNFHYFPTDCPQREKNGWTADATLSTEEMLMNFAPENSLSVWLNNICKAQAENGSLPGIIPTGGWGFAWGNGPAWDCVLTFIPYLINRYTGDKRVLSACADSILKYLEYLQTRRDDKGLIAIGLGDWCPPDKSADDYVCPLVVTDSILSMDIAKKASYIFSHTGRGDAKKYALELAASLRQSIRENLINGVTVEGESQTSQAMGIYYGCFEPDEEKAAFEKLVEYISAADDHFNAGVLGAQVLYEVLSRFGRTDLALKMIITPTFPSYGWLVKTGCTTLPEMFYKKVKDSESYNHHFWSFVSAWFYRWLGGIKIPENEISPVFAEGIDFVKCHTRDISVAWHRQADGIEVKITIPKPMTVLIPGQKPQKLPAGSHEFIVKR